MVQRAGSARQQFVDAIDSTTQAAANKWDLSAYQNAPKQPGDRRMPVAAQIANRRHQLRCSASPSALAPMNRTRLGGFSPIERKIWASKTLRETPEDGLAKRANKHDRQCWRQGVVEEEAAATTR